MPALIDLKTNLKSLGYGSDRPDGGSSNQPYIVTPIPDGETLNSPDFLLRNGYLNPVNSFKDTERLLKYFTDIKTPSGLLFTAKQELLERQNPKLVNINRVYNPFSTIFQASLLSIGQHLNKQGIDPNEPSYYLGGTYGYFSATRGFGEYPTFQTLSNGDIENRLTIAYTAKIAKQDLGSLNINPFGITRISGDNILLSYNGGPGSVLGIGNTNIRIQNPTQTRKSNWSYEKTLEEEVFPSDISFKPVYISNIPDVKGYLTPSIPNPSINWQYDFFLDNKTVSRQFLKLYPTDEIYNTLYLGGNDLETQRTLFTPGGTPDLNIANNNQINYVSGITGFKYDPNNSNPKTGLIPYNKHPHITWAYNFTNYNRASSAIFSNTEWGEFKANASGALFLSNSTLNKTGDNIANNLNITKFENVGVKDRFLYSTNIAEVFEIKDYLSPIGKEVSVVYKFGVSKEYSDKYANELRKSNETIYDINQQDTTVIRNLESSPINVNNNSFTFSYSQTLNQASKGVGKSTLLTGITDFRKTIVDSSIEAKKQLPSTDYKNFNREKTYKTSTTTYRGNYSSSKYILDPNLGISSDLVSGSNDDLINFKFTTYNASNTTDTIYFRAYLEDWSDSYKAEWNGIKYMGRAEQLYKYNGFSRNGSVSFNVPVLSKLDLGKTYSRLNRLVNTVAPFYSTGTSSGVKGLMTGVITKITMGDYWKNMPVLINSVNYTPISDMGWDIGRNIDGTKTKRINEQLPKGMKVSLDFTIIHNYTPQYGKNFITN